MKQVQDPDVLAAKVHQIVAVALNKDVSQLDYGASQQLEEDWDSLGQLRIIAGLEDSFAIEFSDEQVTGLHNLPELIQAVIELLGRRGNRS